MKKIVFVEKQQGSYDPVANFFNKKNATPSIPNKTGINQTTSSNQRSTSKKISSKIGQPEKIPLTKKEETPKVPAKQQCLLPHPKTYPSREEANKSRDIGKRNIKKESKTSITYKSSQEDIIKASNILEDFKEDSLQKNVKNESPPRPKNETSTQPQKGGELVKRINELQLREQEYIRKIEQLQAKEQKHVKNEQKFTKIEKDYKLALQRSKEAEGVLEKLKEKDKQIKELMEGKSIPFSRKREVILSNKIHQLKRVNRELVVRLKNYKGTDLVELSIQQNRQEIMKDLYTVDVQKQLNQQMNIEMESLLTQLSHKLQQYIDKRVKIKGERLEWSQEHAQLLDLTHLAQKIALNYLEKYQICPLPQSNEEATSVYSILEQYKQCNPMQKAIDHYHLNLQLSKENSQTIQHIQDLEQQMMSIKTEVGRPKKKDKAKNKQANLLTVYQRRLNFIQNLLIQNICHQQNVKQWIQKTHGRVNEQVSAISKTMSEIRDIVAIGQSAKQSLYLYLSTNISQLECKFPNLKLSLREIKASFADLERCC